LLEFFIWKISQERFTVIDCVQIISTSQITLVIKCDSREGLLLHPITQMVLYLHGKVANIYVSESAWYMGYSEHGVFFCIYVYLWSLTKGSV